MTGDGEAGPDLTGGGPVILESAAEMTAALDEARARGATVGFVPTMGSLHAGHTSLIGRARAECYVVAVSVFVNPTQFEDSADLAAYPRDPLRDAEIAASAGADYIFVPSVDEMYPPNIGGASESTTVSVGGLSTTLEGASRPGHFDGVATVVTKLFSIVGRCRAYFGEKDFQQLLVVTRLVEDLRLPVEVVGCPTVREEDGLALSSRNARLSPDERYAAAALHQALQAGKAGIDDGESHPEKIEAAMQAVIESEPLAAVDYAVCVRAADLIPVTTIEDDVRLLVAARLGHVRLIDNIGVEVSTRALEGDT